MLTRDVLDPLPGVEGGYAASGGRDGVTVETGSDSKKKDRVLVMPPAAPDETGYPDAMLQNTATARRRKAGTTQ